MRIALIGYGKMGKAIEQIALKRGHEISFRIDLSNQEDLKKIAPSNTDAVIEFTQPETAFPNISTVLKNGVPVVCGTTGWLEHKPQAEKLAKENNTAFFYSSNYSVGVNIFFHLNKYLAKVMSNFGEYHVWQEEIHHTEKKDSPSGTSITLAEGVLENIKSKSKWVNESTSNPTEFGIVSVREPNVPGTHTIFYESPIDTIEIKHTAHSREGFATGAVLAAEFVKGKHGVFGMDDMLKIS